MCWCRQGGTGVDTLGTRAEQMNVVGLAKAWLWQVDRRGHRPALHLELAKKCAMVVAEEPFCVPFLKGVEERSGTAKICKCCSNAPAGHSRVYQGPHATQAMHYSGMMWKSCFAAQHAKRAQQAPRVPNHSEAVILHSATG